MGALGCFNTLATPTLPSRCSAVLYSIHQQPVRTWMVLCSWRRTVSSSRTRARQERRSASSFAARAAASATSAPLQRPRLSATAFSSRSLASSVCSPRLISACQGPKPGLWGLYAQGLDSWWISDSRDGSCDIRREGDKCTASWTDTLARIDEAGERPGRGGCPSSKVEISKRFGWAFLVTTV